MVLNMCLICLRQCFEQAPATHEKILSKINWFRLKNIGNNIYFWKIHVIIFFQLSKNFSVNVLRLWKSDNLIIVIITVIIIIISNKLISKLSKEPLNRTIDVFPYFIYVFLLHHHFFFAVERNFWILEGDSFFYWNEMFFISNKFFLVKLTLSKLN